MDQLLTFEIYMENALPHSTVYVLLLKFLGVLNSSVG